MNLVVCLLSLVVAAPAWSQQKPQRLETAYGAKPGAYVALSGFVGFDTSGGDITETDDGGGIATRVGFRIFDPVAFELQGDYFSGLEDLEGWTITLNVRTYLMEIWRENPGRFQIYALVGGGVMGGSTDSFTMEVAFRLGGGINYYFTDKLALDIGGDWATGRGDFEDVSYGKAAIGLQYNF